MATSSLARRIGALAGALVALSPPLAVASATLDGAGLFALPAERILRAPSPAPAVAPRRAPFRLGWHLAHSIAETVERARRLAVTPMVFGMRGIGMHGIGVSVSGRM